MGRNHLLWIAVPAVIVVILVAVTGSVGAAWRVDFSNTAWGAIGGAFIAAVLGTYLKALFDAELAKQQAALKQEMDAKLAEQQAALKQRVDTELTERKARLDDRNSAEKARRDYEYEARKSLYTQVEPLLFQLHEATDEALHRVLSLARSDRQGNLGDGAQSWIARDGYYLYSTVYKLLLPTAFLRLMQRRLTFFDLGLDPKIESRYRLLKLYVRALTDDFVLAAPNADRLRGESKQEFPPLPYDPNHREWKRLREELPAQHARQGLVVGDVEAIADLLIVKEGNESRAMFFSEFEQLVRARAGDNQDIQECLRLFRGFSSVGRPVLARILIAQACLARVMVAEPDPAEELIDSMSRLTADADFVTQSQWASPGDHRQIALEYWSRRLPKVAPVDTQPAFRVSPMARGAEPDSPEL